MVDVPHVVGTTPALAVEELTAKHLIPIIRFVNSTSKEPGTVVAQNPLPSARVVRETKVVISVVSAIPRPPTVAPSPADLGLGSCPARLLASVTSENAVAGLDKKLVPINAERVRVCRYDAASERLTGTGLLSARTATKVEAEANALHATLSYNGSDTCLALSPVFDLMFASDVARIEVIVLGCLGATNGDALARPTTKWLTELQRAIDCKGPTLGIECAVGRKQPADRYAPFPAKFVGDWSVHGATLRINPDGSGRETGYYANCGAVNASGCTETETLDLRRSRDGNSLTGTVRSVVFTDATGAIIADPFPPSSALGDSFRLNFAAPQLLRTTYIKSHLSAQDLRYGNPYWCGPHLASQYRNLCGA